MAGPAKYNCLDGKSFIKEKEPTTSFILHVVVGVSYRYFLTLSDVLLSVLTCDSIFKCSTSDV